MNRIVATLVLLCALAFGARAAEGPPGPQLKLVNFRDVKLIDALAILAEQSGLNLVASSEAAKTTVSLTLRNVPARLAVETLCKAHNLWLKDDQGICRIMTALETQRDLSSFREEKTEVFSLLYPNAVPIAVAIRDLYGDRVQLSLGSEARTDETDDLYERFDRFDVIDQRSQSLGLFDGNSNSGVSSYGNSGSGSNRSYSGQSGGYTQRGFAQQSNTQRRRDDYNTASRDNRDDLQKLTPDQLQALSQQAKSGDGEQLIQRYRRRQAEIYVTLSRRNNLVAVRTSDDKAVEDIAKLVRRLDVPTSTVLLEVKVLSIELSKDMSSAFDFQFTDGTSSAGGFSNGNIQPPGADLLRSVTQRNAALGLGGTGLNAGSLAFQYVNNNFRARLQALEGRNKVTTLATPMLMTANNEVSRLFVGEERPIVRNINSNAVVNQTTVTNGSNTAIEFRPVGTTLLITPNINADRTVTLRILQENSTINKDGAQIPVVTDKGLQQQSVDVVNTRSASGTFVAHDNLMLAIGGLIEEGISDQRSQVPLLGNLPGVGVIFRRQNKNKSRSELVILIKPRILTTPSEGECVSRELLEQLSIHPKAPNPTGTMNLYAPAEVLPLSKEK